MTDQERERVIEAVANKLEYWAQVDHNERPARAMRCQVRAKELLALKWPCGQCGGTGKFAGVVDSWPTSPCPDCKGTGQSDVPVIAVLARDQKPPSFMSVGGISSSELVDTCRKSYKEAGFRRII